jgi:hypothetical protein
MDAIGSQRVGIVRQVPVLDGGGQPVLTSMRRPRTAESVVWVDGASLELQNATSPTATEQQTSTETTTSDKAWAFLPVANGVVPLIDGTTLAADAITSAAAIRYRGRDYQLRGDAQLMEDIDGNEDHVFILAERQTG